MKKLGKDFLGNIWVRALFVSLFCTLISILFYEIGTFEYLENKSYDRRMNNSAVFVEPSEDIVFIAVDQESIDWAYENKGWSWPWPREAYSNIVDFLSAGNVNSIMFDVLFTEPSIYGPEDDKKFAESQKKSGKVVQTVFLQDSNEILYPIEQLKNTSAIVANVRSSMDKDDVVRRFKPFEKINGVVYPSLGMAPLFLENKINESNINIKSMAKDGTVKLRFQKTVEKYFPYRASDILKSYDYWKSATNDNDSLKEDSNDSSFAPDDIYFPEDFEGDYVFFALYAPGLFDICSTPVSQVYPGVGIHLTALDNYLQNNFINDVPEVVNILWLFIVSLAAALIVGLGEKQKTQLKIILFLSIGFILGGIITFEIPFILFIFGINLNQTGPLISYFISFVIMFGVIYMMEGKQKRFIKAAFSQCLSKDVVNNIVNDPSSFTLGGKKFQMTAIFTDIEKFSSISELLTASQLGKLLNYYLTKMSDVIIKENGTIDKYEGDAIVAMVGAPVKMEDHAVRARNAAIKMKKEELLMNQQIKALVEKDSLVDSEKAGIDEELFESFKILIKNGKHLFTRIGINSGEMIAGYFGSTLKKNYTIMGNNVNLASRLEGVNKQYSTYGILISEFTKNLIGEQFVVRSLDRVQVVNVNTPIQLYELLEKADCSVQLKDYVKKWEEAMDLFKKENYSEALSLFMKLSEKKSDDKVAKYYISLIENFFINGKYPVESDGVGVAYNPELKVFKLLQK